jgi:hypothetical protein
MIDLTPFTKHEVTGPGAAWPLTFPSAKKIALPAYNATG